MTNPAPMTIRLSFADADPNTPDPAAVGALARATVGGLRASALSAVAAELAQANSIDNLRALVRNAWRTADTNDYFFQLADLPQGQMIIAAGLDRSILDSIAWVRQFLQNH
ncbi:hypothetical protein EKD04_023510 [Chloroflexales bacterium ZM16-3]|nr:hypothetical protein [Chloroflexales bacterium ZM16-3]